MSGLRSLRISGKRVAYCTVPSEDGRWGVGVVFEGQPGYRPVPDYGPYEGEERAEGVVERLNARIGLDARTALAIVATTFGARPRLKAPAAEPRRRAARQS